MGYACDMAFNMATGRCSHGVFAVLEYPVKLHSRIDCIDSGFNMRI